MQKYNPKDWFGLIFRFHKSDTFRKLFWIMVSLAVYAVLLVYLELEVFNLEFASPVMHSLLGFVISLLLVFRTNTAYDRWWEGRKQWGALVNVSRNILLKFNAFTHDEAAKQRMSHLVAAYAHVLKEHLRETSHKEKAALLPSFVTNTKPVHVPNNIAAHMQLEIELLKKDRTISDTAYLALLNDLSTFTDICGACERIKKTPIPYNYNIFIKKFIFAYIVTIPIGFAAEYGYWAVFMAVFSFYTLASLELIAEDIEDPFGKDPDDLPTDDLANTIEKNSNELVSNE